MKRLQIIIHIVYAAIIPDVDMLLIGVRVKNESVRTMSVNGLIQGIAL